MIKMKFVFSATDDALAFISLPNCELYTGGNYSASLCIWADRCAEVFVTFNCH